MSWFKDLKVFYKIMLILLVYALALIINLVIGRSALLETQGHLVNLEQQVYDSVQLATVNEPLLKRADELLTQAVSFGEADLKSQGEASIQTLLDNLDKLKQIDQDRTQILDSIIANVNAYRDVSVPIVNGMLDGSADFGVLQEKIAQKADLFEKTNISETRIWQERFFPKGQLRSLQGEVRTGRVSM